MSLLLAAALVAQTPPTGGGEKLPLANRMQAFVEAFHRRGLFSGTVLVARKGQVLFEGSAGLANREWNVPNSPDTAFRIGSLTKTITAALVLRLVDEGKLRLDGSLASQLPGYREDTGARVTVRQLLAHTSGIPSFTREPDYLDFVSQSHSVAGFVKNHCSGDLEFEPGTRWAYSNSGYFLLGALVEQATGLPYAEALQKFLFAPLGMTHSRFDAGPALIPKRASGYVRTLSGWVEAPHLDDSVLFSTGGIRSTAGDLLRFAQGLSGTYLSEGSRAQMWKVQSPAGPGPAYGLGWFLHVVPVPGRPAPLQAQSHGGEVDGFNAQVLRIPEEGLTVILLHNQGPTRLPELSTGLVHLALGLNPPPPRAEALDLLLPLLRDQGLAAAVTKASSLASDPTTMPFREEEAGTFGMYLLRLRRHDEAALVFGLASALVPESPRAKASLGRALEMAGKPKEALEAYEAALKLDTRDPLALSGVQRLKR